MQNEILSDGYGLFPNVESANEDGLLAIGATLATDRLIYAYHNGIFPWFSEGDPIMWYSPPERFVLFPVELKISKSMQQFIRNTTFHITENTAFEEVIKNCSLIERKGQAGTWIVNEMITAYTDLHKMGFAKSVEVWDDKELVGGLYGIEMNKIFCGESMFSKKSNASKLSLIHLSQSRKYELIDCQVYTNHLARMGARLISRKDFMDKLKEYQ